MSWPTERKSASFDRLALALSVATGGITKSVSRLMVCVWLLRSENRVHIGPGVHLSLKTKGLCAQGLLLWEVPNGGESAIELGVPPHEKLREGGTL